MNCDRAEFTELSAEILGRGSRMRFRARGGSMRPLIRDGEIIEVKPAKVSEIRVGDIIFYRASWGSMVAHRVIKKRKEKGKMVLVTKGDSAPGFDGQVYLEQIFGKVVTVEKKGRNVKLDKSFWKLLNFFWAIVSPYSLWIYPSLSKFKQGIYKMLDWMLRKPHGFKVYRNIVRRFVKGKIRYQMATSDDAFSLSRLYHYDKRPELKYPTETFNKQIRSLKDSGYCFVAKKGNKVIGSVTIRNFPWSAFPYNGWWLFALFVNFRYRGMGVGERLAKMAIERAAKEGASEVKLTVLENAKAAINLYRKLGFHQIFMPELEEQFREEIKKGLHKRIVLRKYISNK